MVEKLVNFLLQGKSNVKSRFIQINSDKFKKVIGIPISLNETKKYLILVLKQKFLKSLKIEIPTWRPDVKLDVDIIEELIRIKRI